MNCIKRNINPKPVYEFTLSMNEREARILTTVLYALDGNGKIREIIDNIGFELKNAGALPYPSPGWLGGRLTARGDLFE